MPEGFYGSAEIRWFLKGHNQLGKILKWFCL
jgi:hypothetical protein